MLIAALLLASAPRLGLIDDTAAGSPAAIEAARAVVTNTGRYDVQPPEVVEAAVAEARRVGAACGFDDTPECWAKLGIFGELDRLLVLRKGPAAVEMLLVDVPARTATRAAAVVSDDAEVAARTGEALSALLEGRGQPVAADVDVAPHGVAWWSGAYLTGIGAVVGVGCGVGATALSAELSSRLTAARAVNRPLGADYGVVSTAFWVTLGCAAAGAASAAGGGVLWAVAP